MEQWNRGRTRDLANEEVCAHGGERGAQGGICIKRKIEIHGAVEKQKSQKPQKYHLRKATKPLCLLLSRGRERLESRVDGENGGTTHGN